ncbi:hypothetical protein [Agriterribacter sp.]|uniref:hypothetical protein n=1 Tax=Agriterribacter sp. TaxID=2821509 RepID=UPI002B8359EE|nr:hypothetical protein [Agriterribacter sp.]HRO45692.1 hypothetical protein [Agriterribacter sp.]HRQ15830.1 hypothetical protein [Agriterribacter sp.]
MIKSIYIFCLLLPLLGFNQTYKKIDRYFLLEIQTPQGNQIDFLRLALVPLKPNTDKSVFIKKLRKMKHLNLNRFSDYSKIYNFLPVYHDSYLRYSKDTSDYDSYFFKDTSRVANFLQQYLAHLSNGTVDNFTNETVILRIDNILVKLFEVKGNIWVVNFDTGVNLLSANRKIRDNYIASNSELLGSDTMRKNEKFILNDVFLPCKKGFVLTGGEFSIENINYIEKQKNSLRIDTCTLSKKSVLIKEINNK